MYSKGRKVVQEIGSRLQQVRKQAGLSAAEMAVRLEVSRGGYAKNEGGLNIPSLDKLRYLTREFDISMDWLLFNKGPMHFKEKSEKEKALEQTVDDLTRTGEGLRKETAEARKEAAELRDRFEEERKKQEEAVQERAEAFDMDPEVRELLDRMEQDHVFYHRLMLNFQEFKQRESESLEAETPDPQPQSLKPF